MTDPDTTTTSWATRWAQGRTWALANPKAARAILLGVIVLIAFIAGAVVF